MNKVFRILITIFLIMLLLQFIYVPICYATEEGFWSKIFQAGDKFLEEGKEAQEQDGDIDGDKVQNELDKIYNILFILGVGLTVIIGAVLGIKFMMGSVEEQAKIKETLIPYVVGCIVIFGAFGIWKLMVTLLSSI